MLTLLAPTALLGLSLLAIPIVVHLLKPRKVRQTPFSSLRWLHLTQQRLSRRFRWHQILLFLLRAAFITLLVLAVASPILDRRAASGPSERFVILDTSRSMGYRTGDRPTPLDAGKQAAAALLAGGGAKDHTTLLTVDATTKILGPRVRGGERYVAKLAPLAAETTDTDLGSALDVVQALLARRRNDDRIELFVITDSHQGSWRQGAIEEFLAEFPERVAATIVDVSEPAAQNGWIATAHYSAASAGEPPAIDVQLRASGAAGERTVRLVGAAGLNERTQAVTLDPQRPTQVRFELPTAFDARGKTCEVVLDPPDGLPDDDRWYLAFDSQAALDVLLVEGRNHGAGEAPPGFALRTAIEALSSSQQPIRVASKRFNEVQPTDFSAVDVVLCADVPEFSDVVLEGLAERVRQGMGLGVFLGPGVDADFYNRRLIDPLDRSRSLLPVRLESVVNVPLSAGGLIAWDNVAWNNLLLAGLFDPVVGDLAQVRAKTYCRLASSPADGATVLAETGGSPAIVEHTVGSGKVVVFNVTADDAWSDLPRRKSFVPLVDRLLNHLSGGALQRSFTTGNAIALALPPLAAGESLTVIGPDGKSLTPSVSAVGAGTRLRLPPLNQPGVYQVRRGFAEAPADSFVVQVGRGDSAIKPIDADLLRSWWQPATCEIVRADAVSVASTTDRTSLIPWAAALAAVVLAVEMLLVHRLCPRMNPKLATSVVQHRRPSDSKTVPGAASTTPLSNARTT